MKIIEISQILQTKKEAIPKDCFSNLFGSIISRVDGNFPQPYFSVYKKANIRYIKIAKPNTKG